VILYVICVTQPSWGLSHGPPAGDADGNVEGLIAEHGNAKLTDLL
jgi:hypothetical protein